MDTTSAKKILKVLCIVCMVVYGLFAVLGIAIMAGVVPLEAVVDGMGVSGMLDSPDATLYSSITGAVIAAVYLIQLLFTIPVLRGIKNPSKMKLGIVLYGILTLFVGVSLVMTLMNGGESAVAISQFVATAGIFGGAIEISRAKE